MMEVIKPQSILCYDEPFPSTLILGIFPNFMNMTALFVIMTQLHLINNLWGLVLLYSSGSTMGFLVQKDFFDTIPGTIYDAATLDGASDFRVFVSITLPLSKPMIVYTALTSFVWPWADFMLPSMLLIDKSPGRWRWGSIRWTTASSPSLLRARCLWPFPSSFCTSHSPNISSRAARPAR